MADEEEKQPIIIKKIKKKADGHHGGAWKVAYADFVTAMMAFFLLLWLLSTTPTETLVGVADYFKPTPRISDSKSGSSGVMGGTTVATDGALTQQIKPLIDRQQKEDPVLKEDISDDAFEREMQRREQEAFEKAEEALKKAIEESPELEEMAGALKIDMTPEGLRIQIIDQEGKPLFATGSATLLPHTKKLLSEVSKIIQKLPNEISVRGHTDSIPYGRGALYTNWELSGDRANASRRELLRAGLPSSRINNIVGKADTDHLYADTPNDGRNRRISIIMLHDYLTRREGANKSSRAVEAQQQRENRPPLYRRSEGQIEFP